MDTRLGPTEEPKLHEHCLSCVKLKCSVSAQDKLFCPMVSCQRQCGAFYHACKELDHELLCPNSRVPCISSPFGCPFLVLRKYMSKHLEVCPASCVVCASEWNRWPVNKAKRSSKACHLSEMDLDVALVLRDQKMLEQLDKVSKKTKYILRNGLTLKYPAVPLVNGALDSEDSSSLTSRTVTDDEEDTPWEVRKCPPGLQTSVCKKLFKTGGDVASLETSVSTVVNEEVQCEEGSNGTEDLGLESDSISNEGSSYYIVNSTASDKFVKSHTPSLTAAYPDSMLVDITVEFLERGQTKPRSMYTFLCGQTVKRSELSYHYLNIHSEIYGGLDRWIQARCPLFIYGCSYVVTRMHPNQDFKIVFDTNLNAIGVSAGDEMLGCRSSKEQDLCPVKSPSAVDIPLKHQDDAVIPLSKCLSSDSIMISKMQKRSSPQLLDIPPEVLITILKCLDSFSLYNVALTCRHLRDICKTLVKSLGVVSLQWKRMVDSKQGWAFTHYRWNYTPACCPIKNWKFDNRPGHLSNHLQHCPVFDRNIQAEPFSYMFR